ncbi:MAG: hypothetical protein R3F43_09180 [bacterium]
MGPRDVAVRGARRRPLRRWRASLRWVGRSTPTPAAPGLPGRSPAPALTPDTGNYIENPVDKAVYIIHGSADDNVPVREGRDMRDAVSQVSDDVHYHEQEGAGTGGTATPRPAPTAWTGRRSSS